MPPYEYPTNTPWGLPNSTKQIAQGIRLYETPSHGGIWLSPLHVPKFQRVLPAYTPFAGFPWFEEDVDAFAVILVWPEWFKPHECHAAREVARSYMTAKGYVTADYWRTTHAAFLLRQCNRHEENMRRGAETALDDLDDYRDARIAWDREDITDAQYDAARANAQDYIDRRYPESDAA